MHSINVAKRELEVFRLIAEEFTNKEISSHLGISVGSVETHRKNLFNKFSARNMAGLIKRAFDSGVLTVVNAGGRKSFIKHS